jgi:hypothetical protein
MRSVAVLRGPALALTLPGDLPIMPRPNRPGTALATGRSRDPHALLDPRARFGPANLALGSLTR